MQTRTSSRILELDGLRGSAILLVVAFHYIYDTLPDPDHLPVVRWLEYGYSGVDLFFVLSGFLVGGILMDVREKPLYFRTFYLRRTCRILPLYYFTLALYACGRLDFLSGQLKFPWLFQDALPLLSYATFTQNFAMAAVGHFGANFIGVTWSVAVEEQFYLTLPVLVRYLSHRLLATFLFVSILTVPLLRWYLISVQGHAIGAYALIFCRADALYLGVLAAWLWRNEICRAYLCNRRSVLALLLVLSGAYLIFLKQVRGESVLSMEMATSGYSTFGLFYTSLLLLVLTDKGHLAAFFRARALRATGEISYGIYMMHKPVSGLLHALIRHDQPDISTLTGAAVQALAFVVMFAMAYFSWHIFERTFVEFGHKHSYDQPASAATVAGLPAQPEPARIIPVGIVPPPAPSGSPADAAPPRT